MHFSCRKTSYLAELQKKPKASPANAQTPLIRFVVDLLLLVQLIVVLETFQSLGLGLGLGHQSWHPHQSATSINCIHFRVHLTLLGNRSTRRHATGSRNIKPKVVFKLQKVARYALFCLIMGPFKGKVPVFARLWPVMVMVRVSFTTGAVRSAILATAGLLVYFMSLTKLLCNDCLKKCPELNGFDFS